MKSRLTYRSIFIATMIIIVVLMLMILSLSSREFKRVVVMGYQLYIPANLVDSKYVVLVSLTIITLLTPIAILEYRSYLLRIKLEESLPTAFRLVADVVRAGSTLDRAIELIAHSDLRPLNVIMARAIAYSRISGIPITNAITEISDRLKIPALSRFAVVVSTVARSGARIEEVLDIAAKTFEGVQAYRRERKTHLQPYIVVAYVMILVFILVSNLMIYAVGNVSKTLAKPTVAIHGVPVIRLAIDVDLTVAMIHYTGLIQCIATSLIIGKVIYENANAGLIHAVIMITLLTVLNYFVMPLLSRVILQLGY